MDTIATLSDLLTHSGAQFRIYDIGRKIDKLSKQQFHKIELNQLPYPTPLLGHGHLAIVFWHNATAEPYLWFIKLPLDERGLLNQGARDHFIAIVIEALGADLTADASTRQQEILQSNPYLFTPSQYKMAALNGLISSELKKPASRYYANCQQYLAGAQDWQQWHNIAVQGLADVAARLDQDNNDVHLQQALRHLPQQVLLPLCSTLENVSMSPALLQQLCRYYMDSKDVAIKTQVLRSMASNAKHPFVLELVDGILQQAYIDNETLIVLASRCWQALNEPQRLMFFLEALVARQPGDDDIFAAIFRDLVAIPDIRPVLFSCMRDPQRSQTLAQAIGRLFNQVTA